MLFCCEKEDEVEATVVNYYISATESSKFDRVLFTFDHTRAIRENEIRTFYLDPKDIILNLSDPDDVFLGSLTIEPIKVKGYDFGFSDFKVTKSGETFLLTQPYLNNNYSESTFFR